MPKPEEVATLYVNGLKFEDWEFVMVRRAWRDNFAYFQFSAAERDPVFKPGAAFPDWKKLQFKPGDRCKVELAGQLAVDGFIETRQVAYDANSHGVMLIGKSYAANGGKSSVDTATGSFDEKNIQQVATEVWAPYGVQIRVIGQLDLTPFDKLQCNKGETCWDFTERIARDRGVVLASDKNSNLLLIGDHKGKVVDGLIEGKNILVMQCIITDEMVFEKYDVHGQSQASDDHHGTDASEQKASATSQVATMYSKLITDIEEPVKTPGELQTRAETERKWGDGTQVVATITVQGWLREGDELWEEGDHVYVKSPMAMLDEELAIQQVIFMQDDKRGTVTVLTCVNPAWLNAQPDFKMGG